MKKLLTSIRNLGSSLVAGSSDNDPTTVATLAVVGSTVGLGLNWLLLLILPLLPGLDKRCSYQQRKLAFSGEYDLRVLGLELKTNS